MKLQMIETKTLQNQCSEYRGIIVEEVETQAPEEKSTHDASIQGQVN